MRPGLTLAAGALVLACAASASAAPPRGDREGRRPRTWANPSAVVAAELAFARLAHDKGQWTAFRETAAEDAEMFAPQRVAAHVWLEDKADPPVAVAWQPHQVWSSCDGSAAVTRGAWQGPKATGVFTTVWRRQDKGGYKWVLDQGDALPQPLPAPEMIAAKVAECGSAGKAVPLAAPAPPGDARAGSSDDRTLQWTSQVDARGARRFTVWLWNGAGFDTALDMSFAAPSGEGARTLE